MIDLSPGWIVLISSLCGAAATSVPKVLQLFSRGKLASRRAELQSLQQGQVNLENAWNRLEGENTRLNEDMKELRTELDSEREAHWRTRRRLNRVEEECALCHRNLRMLGKDVPRLPLDPDEETPP